jgi:murein DD-endopeptidase MepM/ murein hydrolase activator NlpD
VCVVTRPEIKKASELINLKSHKQEKYISLMIVPSDSASKTRTLHITHTVFYGTILVALGIFMFFAAVYLRSFYFEQRSHNLSLSLEETQESFASYQLVTADTNIFLRDNSMDLYFRLANEESRAQTEIQNQQLQHRENFQNAQNHINNLERQIREFEEERQGILNFLDERAQMIPPIASLVRELEESQETLINELYNVETQTIIPRIGLMGGTRTTVTATELRARVETLSAEMDLQRQLFENLDEFTSQMDDYLRDFPTLMPVVGGEITSNFGYRTDPINGSRAFHEGVDIPAPPGTPIHAAGGGVVTYEGWRNGYGYVIYLCHGNGIETRYAHNTDNFVIEGQRVERGDIIATVGDTGRAISTHLHYEVVRNGRQINPLPFISEEWVE